MVKRKTANIRSSGTKTETHPQLQKRCGNQFRTLHPNLSVASDLRADDPICQTCLNGHVSKKELLRLPEMHHARGIRLQEMGWILPSCSMISVTLHHTAGWRISYLMVWKHHTWIATPQGRQYMKKNRQFLLMRSLFYSIIIIIPYAGFLFITDNYHLIQKIK